MGLTCVWVEDCGGQYMCPVSTPPPTYSLMTSGCSLEECLLRLADFSDAPSRLKLILKLLLKPSSRYVKSRGSG